MSEVGGRDEFVCWVYRRTRLQTIRGCAPLYARCPNLRMSRTERSRHDRRRSNVGSDIWQDDTIIKLSNTTEYLRFIYEGLRQESGGDPKVITMLHVR